MYNLKLKEFPLERLYFLESREFLDQKFKVYLKQNLSYKINSFYLGMSKRRVNNDKKLFLYNGLRSYYDVNTKFVKNPQIWETKPPLSKITLNFIYRVRKRKYQDLIIKSLKLFSRPTITLVSDSRGSGDVYLFPYKLLAYLNEGRKKMLIKQNLLFWKSNFTENFKYVKLRMKINPKRYNKKSFRSLDFSRIMVLGFLRLFFHNYQLLINHQILQQKSVIKSSVGTPKIFRKRKVKKYRMFYKVKRIIKKLLLSSIKKREYFSDEKILEVETAPLILPGNIYAYAYKKSTLNKKGKLMILKNKIKKISKIKSKKLKNKEKKKINKKIKKTKIKTLPGKKKKLKKEKRKTTIFVYNSNKS